MIVDIWEALYKIHMPIPTEEIFRKTAKEFYEIWKFPHVLGCEYFYLLKKKIPLECLFYLKIIF